MNLFPEVEAIASARPDDRRFTPSIIVKAIERLCGMPFTLDVAAESTPGGFHAPRYFTIEDDGLHRSWLTPCMVWCNPPYSDKDAWIEKAAEEAKRGVKGWIWLPLTADSSRHRLLSRSDGLVMAAWRVQYFSACGLNTSSPNAVLQAGFAFGFGRKLGVWQVWEDGALTELGR